MHVPGGLHRPRRGSGRHGGARFQDALKLFARPVNIGDARPLACQPASSTHRQRGADELGQAGVGMDRVRLALVIEHFDERREGLEQVLDAVRQSGSCDACGQSAAT